MGEIKHTPGPWEIIPARPHEEIEGAFDAFASIEGADGMPVCVFGDSSGSATMFENEADYHLIAAAPEMKEALEEARTTLSVTRTNIMVEMKRSEGAAYRFEGVPEILKARIDAIDAALTKANGKRPPLPPTARCE